MESGLFVFMRPTVDVDAARTTLQETSLPSRSAWALSPAFLPNGLQN